MQARKGKPAEKAEAMNHETHERNTISDFARTEAIGRKKNTPAAP